MGAAAFTGCKKDSSTDVNITQSDLIKINYQLKGAWLYPVATSSIVDTTGKVLQTDPSAVGDSYQFDGGSIVTINPGQDYSSTGSYTLSSAAGSVYVNMVFADGSSIKYKILNLNSAALNLSSTTDTIYNNGNQDIPAKIITNLLYQKQSSVDQNANVVNIVASSDSVMSVSVHVTHKDALNQVLVATASNVKIYNYSFIAQSQDHITISLQCRPSTTNFGVFYKGQPLTGEVTTIGNEIVTGIGWDIP
jgi:hypothetical protein